MRELMLDIEDERTFVLKELEVYNWGPFAKKHRAQFDERGTAIIGSTGSGKTTLVDALMTLIAENPRYNLASTGGHDKNDRTLASYIRGVLGGQRSDQVARPGKTVTGLGATFSNSQKTVRLGAILWFDSTSNSQQDLKRRWFFTESSEQSLDELLQHWGEGGARQLMKHGRESANLRIFESKRPYLAHLRKFFDVGENAFNLLNRAAGLKQLDSVDTIFRELVLDDRSAFSRALEVATEFDNLAGIYKQLEDARHQQESLLPIESGSQKHQKLTKKLQNLRELKKLAPRWFAHLSILSLENEICQNEEKLSHAQNRQESQQAELSRLIATEENLLESYLQLGGSDIKSLEQNISTQQELLKSKEKEATRYQSLAQAMQLDDMLSEASLKRNQELLRQKKPQIEQALSDLEEQQAETIARLHGTKQEVATLQRSIQEVQASPSSNLPPHYQRFRKELAHHLTLDETDLPFVAELVEVQAEESEWRGAIERALGANRLRILTPTSAMHEALSWVNHRNNRLHVRLQEAFPEEPDYDFFPDSFINKLNRKKHPLHASLEYLLAGQDYHCVTDTEQLHQTDYALTREGTMSGREGRFDKQDQKGLHENWLTGFDNKDQLRQLTEELKRHEIEVAKLTPQAQKFKQKRNNLENDIRLLDNIIALSFSEINSPQAASDLKSLEEKLAHLLAPNSDASAAHQNYQTAKRNTQQGREALALIEKEITLLTSEIKKSQATLAHTRERLGEKLTEEEINNASTRIPDSKDLSSQDIINRERKAISELDEKIEKQSQRLSEQENKLIAYMSKARTLNEGAYVDSGTELNDIPVYLEQLRILREEALPKKEKSFREYLNHSSDQGVTLLLSKLEQEISSIEERLSELNQTLAKVDFREGRFLQLEPQRLSDPRVRELEKAQRELRSAMLKDDGGKSHFEALKKIITIVREAGQNRQLMGSKALLDPRYRLQFFVREVDRQSGERSSGRTGSQSGSGGEKELMASHILTASLSYALCPSGANRPLYGSIILDEAFSKSSQSAARLIVEALNIFGLHPIFVTPNKEISLLKKYTRRAICVQRLPTQGSSLATVSWEQLAELRPPSST